MTKRIFLVLFCLLCLTACGGQQERPVLTEVPTLEEIAEYQATHTLSEAGTYNYLVKTLLSQQSAEQITPPIAESFNEWSASQSYKTFVKTSIVFSRKLEMELFKNARDFNDIVADIEIWFGHESANYDTDSLFDKIAYDLGERLSEDTTQGVYKLGQVNVVFCSAEGEVYSKRQSTYSISDSGSEADFQNYLQPEDEYHVQTIAYEYGDELNSELSSHPDDPAIGTKPYGDKMCYLTHFGITDGTDELYIKYKTYDDIPPETDDIINGLREKSLDLYGRITEDEIAAKYLEDNDITKITVVFDFWWDKGGERSFTHDIN